MVLLTAKVGVLLLSASLTAKIELIYLFPDFLIFLQQRNSRELDLHRARSLKLEMEAEYTHNLNTFSVKLPDALQVLVLKIKQQLKAKEEARIKKQTKNEEKKPAKDRKPVEPVHLTVIRNRAGWSSCCVT